MNGNMTNGSNRLIIRDGDGYIWHRRLGYMTMSRSGGRIPFRKHIRVKETEKLPPAESPPTKINLPVVPNDGKFCSIQL